MSAAASAQLARHTIPEEVRKQYALGAILVFGGAAARGEDNPGAKMYAHLLRVAVENGFLEGDVLEVYARRNRYTKCAEEIALSMIERIGGHDAVLDICDLYAFDPTNYGALQ